MATAALVISILAIIGAAVAILYGRRQTSAVEAQARVAERQVHSDQEPDIEVAVEADRNQKPAVSGVLSLTHWHGPALRAIELEIVVPPKPPLEVPIPTFGPGNHTRMASLGPLGPGEILRQSVVLNPSPPKAKASFRLTCWPDNGEPWIISRSVEAPVIRAPARSINLGYY